VRFLLDTNAFWAWIGSTRFDRAVRRRVEAHGAVVSSVSMYELGNKVALGKLRSDVAFGEAVAMHGFGAIDLTHAHASRAARLPVVHRDPFDRLLIAQAQIEDLTIVTRDRVFDRYDVDVVAF
jgi:PIN domain nuclease of toxin-antitoxin system